VSRPAAEWLAVGRVRKPHGVHGELLAEILTDFPERVAPGVELGIGQPPERSLTVARVRLHKGAWLLTLEGVETREAAEALRDAWLSLPEQARDELPTGYFYEHELAGLSCVDRSGHPLGEVTGVSDVGGGALLVVRTDAGEVLVPFRPALVVEVDLGARRVVLDPPKGLFDDDAL
jgi:16S rRNA processing protein RimM